MATCPNCGTAMSCGCQKRVVNGINGCSKCLSNAPKKTIQRNQPTQNQAVWGKDRYNNLSKFTK